MIEIKEVSKKYDSQIVVNNLSLKVSKGEVLGFLGPNGAGKTTTMKMITGFINPNAGDILVNNYSVLKNPLEVKKSIGYLPEGAPHYGEMKTGDFLKFISKIRNISKEKTNDAINYVIEALSLETMLEKRIEHLSKGFKRRVGLAQAIIHNPNILILDEPTDGLDPNQKHEVRNLIKKISKDKTIIISTHILEEVGAVCSNASIIANGNLVYHDSAVNLKKLGKGSYDEVFRKLTTEK